MMFEGKLFFMRGTSTFLLMVFRNLCVLVLWMKVASALKGLYISHMIALLS